MANRAAVTTAATLDELLAHLEAAIPAEQQLLHEMRRQGRPRQIRVVVLGEAKRGKSSLINALVGRAVLPTGVIPCDDRGDRPPLRLR